MRKAADILYLFATFSVRVDQIDKALEYAKIGCKLFPDDLRLLEMHAYALLLKREYEKAEALLASTDASTRNLEYLRSRTAIFLGMPKDVRKSRIKAYLGETQVD